MAKEIPLNKLGDELELRIRKYIRSFDVENPRVNEALLRIGLLLEAEVRQNIRRKGIIDTGRLLNSIRHEIYKKRDSVGVKVGSFGVPYAGMHEFGGPFTDPQRKAMFASLRERGKLGPSRQPGKGVVVGGRFMARPYLRPALIVHKRRILDIIRGLVA